MSQSLSVLIILFTLSAQAAAPRELPEFRRAFEKIWDHEEAPVKKRHAAAPKEEPLHQIDEKTLPDAFDLANEMNAFFFRGNSPDMEKLNSIAKRIRAGGATAGKAMAELVELMTPEQRDAAFGILDQRHGLNLAAADSYLNMAFHDMFDAYRSSKAGIQKDGLNFFVSARGDQKEAREFRDAFWLALAPQPKPNAPKYELDMKQFHDLIRRPDLYKSAEISESYKLMKSRKLLTPKYRDIIERWLQENPTKEVQRIEDIYPEYHFGERSRLDD